MKLWMLDPSVAERAQQDEAPATGFGIRNADLEGGVVAVGAGGGPRVAATAGIRRCGLRTGGGPRLVGDLTTALSAACRTRHLSGGVAERGADLVDLELDGGALLALTRLVGALLQATGRDDARALG